MCNSVTPSVQRIVRICAEDDVVASHIPFDAINADVAPVDPPRLRRTDSASDLVNVPATATTPIEHIYTEHHIPYAEAYGSHVHMYLNRGYNEDDPIQLPPVGGSPRVDAVEQEPQDATREEATELGRRVLEEAVVEPGVWDIGDMVLQPRQPPALRSEGLHALPTRVPVTDEDNAEAAEGAASCPICLTRVPRIAVIPCGHVVCAQCVNRLVETTCECYCRGPLNNTLRIFMGS
jgi:hypothetical protein